MDKTKKILILVIVVLLIFAGVMTFSYIKTMNTLLSANDQLYKNVKAIEDAGLEAEIQEDGSYLLVERTTPVEYMDE
jgi:flagellar biosynthesis/type III secretory pathway M-ring protein FliF/YscJ